MCENEADDGENYCVACLLKPLQTFVAGIEFYTCSCKDCMCTDCVAKKYCTKHTVASIQPVKFKLRYLVDIIIASGGLRRCRVVKCEAILTDEFTLRKHYETEHNMFSCYHPDNESGLYAGEKPLCTFLKSRFPRTEGFPCVERRCEKYARHTFKTEIQRNRHMAYEFNQYTLANYEKVQQGKSYHCHICETDYETFEERSGCRHGITTINRNVAGACWVLGCKWKYQTNCSQARLQHIKTFHADAQYICKQPGCALNSNGSLSFHHFTDPELLSYHEREFHQSESGGWDDICYNTKPKNISSTELPWPSSQLEAFKAEQGKYIACEGCESASTRHAFQMHWDKEHAIRCPFVTCQAKQESAEALEAHISDNHPNRRKRRLR